MNPKVKHEVLTWGIFVVLIGIIIAPLGMICMYFNIPTYLYTPIGVICGMTMLGVSYRITKKIEKK